MHRGRALIISLAVAAAAIAGVLALRSSVELGAQTRASNDAQVARRAAQLDRYQASLVEALAKNPPALPSLPGTGPAASGSTGSSAQVVYRRPPPVVVPASTSDDEEREDDESEAYEGEGDDD